VNTPAPFDAAQATERVLGWQTKLHRWAEQDEQKRFGDLFNLLCDPATLLVAWERVKRNRGSKTAGVDGQTRWHVEQLGVEKVLGELRQSLRDGSYTPLPVREHEIPKRGSGKVRKLGVPTVRDRIVQMATTLVLEPIWEAEFQPCSYGFRPNRRAQDAIEQVRFFINPPRCYEWAIEGDVEDCFGSIPESQSSPPDARSIISVHQPARARRGTTPSPGTPAPKRDIQAIAHAPGRIRTCDHRIRSPALCPLSYGGSVGDCSPQSGRLNRTGKPRSAAASQQPIRRDGGAYSHHGRRHLSLNQADAETQRSFRGRFANGTQQSLLHDWPS
jgi:hypothetical protein